MTKDLARQPRFTRATASSNNQNDIYGLNGTSDMPMYSTLKALYDGQTWFGPQYARGLPGRKSIERYEAVKRLIEATTVPPTSDTAESTPPPATTEDSTVTTTTVADTETRSTSPSSPTPPPSSTSSRFDLRPRHHPVALPTQSFLQFPASSTGVQGGPDQRRRIQKVQIGSYLIDVWYPAPYPEEYSQLEVLHICDFCLRYMKSAFIAKRHKAKCPMKHPPGDEIYRDGILSVFEVDGRKNKEKQSLLDYNLSCIVTLPSHQRKGYGQFLIDFSYMLSQKEGKIGTPERPLSDLGLLSYRKYWTRRIWEELQKNHGIMSVEELSQTVHMTVQDTVDTLAANDMLRFNEKSARYEIQLSKNKLPKSQRGPTAKMELLTWAPYKTTTANGGDTGEIVNIPREAAAVAAATHTITLPTQGRGRRRKSSSGLQNTGKRRSRKRKLEE
ncbi:histone acetyltransferase kat7 isoform 5 [Lichtheimia corymbifera JMRC:FSU:9682]|uniref:Histone acetyltransferase n=1 Tax=Lichtheimia corymbifera JMRC:FSU:9682 TaxID=1263082 RepID=A0A068S960_9FUNG|nr:histone acetyltransferase kat7 isoform 5 [Lichtheimia corymbifera JMRC:FSU:9682]